MNTLTIDFHNHAHMAVALLYLCAVMLMSFVAGMTVGENARESPRDGITIAVMLVFGAVLIAALAHLSAVVCVSL